MMGIEKCSPYLQVGDLTSYKSDYSNIYRDPLLKVIEAMHIYFSEICPG